MPKFKLSLLFAHPNVRYYVDRYERVYSPRGNLYPCGGVSTSHGYHAIRSFPRWFRIGVYKAYQRYLDVVLLQCSAMQRFAISGRIVHYSRS